MSCASAPADSAPLASAASASPRDSGSTLQALQLTDPQRAWLVERLRADVLGGLLAAGRLLGERGGEQTLSLGREAGIALAEGMPPAFRPWFQDLRSIRLSEVRGAHWLELRFDAWVPPRVVSTGSIRLHDVGIFLARDRVVTARLVLSELEDPRAHGVPVPYDAVKKAPDDVFVKATLAEDYPGGHPFGSGRHKAPAGIDDLRGFTLVATVSGFWMDAVEILPVTRMFEYRGDSDIWISYLDAEEYEIQPDKVPDPTTDPAFDRGRLFFDYTSRRPQPSDVLAFFNMSVNSRNAPPGPATALGPSSTRGAMARISPRTSPPLRQPKGQ